MVLIKDLLKTISFPFIFLGGYLNFLIFKKTPTLSFHAFRFLFVQSNGRLNDTMSSITNFFQGNVKEESISKGVLGELSNKEAKTIVNQIKKDGFYAFDVSLNEQTLDQLITIGKTQKARMLDLSQKGIKYSKEKVLFDGENPHSPRYQFDTSDLVNYPIVQSIMFDDSLRRIAAGYLGTKPILDLIAMWWSAPFKQKGTSQSAQMYHFDMDRFKFIKFFFYLADVHTDNGPHCYIQSSHIRIPKEIRKDRRMNDDELKNYYSAERFKEFTGKKGTILAVDTRGLHKGKPLVSDSRLLLQIQFSNSLFGTVYQRTPVESMSAEHQERLKKHKRTYQLYRASKK